VAVAIHRPDLRDCADLNNKPVQQSPHLAWRSQAASAAPCSPAFRVALAQSASAFAHRTM